MTLGNFIGIGVGPGPAGYIPVAALNALKTADVIFTPRARSAETSVAQKCLDGLGLDASRFREVLYNMDSERSHIEEHYEQLANQIADELRKGSTVAYLTLGDSLTYSTYSYTLAAILKILPNLAHQTFPGITSYAAIASALDFPLGQGKERTLILPCPDDMESLRSDIESHEIIILMKIGHRLPAVISLLSELKIAEHCVLASRIGLPGEVLCSDLSQLPEDSESLGYLSTMLIRQNAPGQNTPVQIGNRKNLSSNTLSGATQGATS
jgi:precorrin-2/cobalt-factor-2 C20-methyltransferase